MPHSYVRYESSSSVLLVCWLVYQRQRPHAGLYGGPIWRAYVQVMERENAHVLAKHHLDRHSLLAAVASCGELESAIPGLLQIWTRRLAAILSEDASSAKHADPLTLEELFRDVEQK